MPSPYFSGIISPQLFHPAGGGVVEQWHADLPDPLLDSIVNLHRATYEDLRTSTPARLIATDDEVRELALYPGVRTLVRYADAEAHYGASSEVAGAVMWTPRLDTVPWISDAWFEANRPEYANPDTCGYLVNFFVDRDLRTLSDLINALDEAIRSEGIRTLYFDATEERARQWQLSVPRLSVNPAAVEFLARHIFGVVHLGD